MEQPLLTTHNLSIGYKDKNNRTLISQKINLSLQQGELVCLVGPNGAGKSTLLRTLAGIQPKLSGEINYRNTPLTSYSAQQLAKEISVVLTDRNFTGTLSVYDLVSLGRHPYTNWSGKLTDIDHQIILNALAMTDSASLSTRSINELSDGELQKVMIARALAQEPTLMLLDEPTAFLDFPHRIDIMRTLRNLSRQNQYSILLSTHDLELALRNSDKLLIMDEAGLLHAGAPEDLILNGSFLQTFNPDSKLEFDHDNGSFHFDEPNRDRINIVGEPDLIRNWTEKALKRIGFEITNQPTPKQVYVMTSKDIHGWSLVLVDGSTRIQVNSIYELTTILRNGNPNHHL